MKLNLLAVSLVAAVFLPSLALAGALGSVTVVHPQVTCPAGAVTGATCLEVQVTCPNTDQINATLGLGLPTGTPTGTIVLHSGSGGEGFLTGPTNFQFGNTFETDHGFRILQISWASDWENTGSDQAGSVLAAACRPATLFNWIYKTYHQSDTTKAYCLLGDSAGSAAVAYSLAHYGLGAEVDAAILSAGPPIANIYSGCVGPASSMNTVCPGVTGLYTYPPDIAPPTGVDVWEHTTTCEDSPSTADKKVWANTGVDTNGAVYDYPQTVLSSWECPNYNEAAGNGAFYWSKVAAAGSVISTTQCATTCHDEEYWMNNAKSYIQMVDQMITDCVPRH